MDKKAYLLRSILYLRWNYIRLSLKEVTEVFRRMTLRVDLFVTCAHSRNIRPWQFFVDFMLESNLIKEKILNE